jgi:hypothetical protein
MTFLGLASLALFATSSPWAPAEWRLDVNIGREEGTWMPDDWATSGGRLMFSIDVMVESDYAEQREAELNFMGPNGLRLSVLEDPCFISSEGEQFIGMPEEGAWKLQMPKRKGTAGTLRFWVDAEPAPDLAEGVAAERNDVALPAERLYFMAKCWREADLLLASRKMKPVEQAAREAQQKLEEQLSHDTGDRRLDGKNPVDTLAGSIYTAQLVNKRDDRLRALKEAEETLPRTADKLLLGAWPGTTEKLAISRGTVAVKRKKLLREEFHVVGKWKAVPILVAVEEQQP